MNHYKSKFINLYIANKVLCISVLISVLILISLSQLTSKTQISFIGLTDSKQHKLSYKYPVQVKKVHIIPGQQVKKGHLLIEVQQPELEVQISTLNNEVEFLINEFKLSKEIATQKKFINSDFKKYNSDPQVLLISSKNKQLEYLYSQKRKQKYYADFDGFVDNVFFKSGEIVPAFTPIAQISPTSPNYAKIYLLEGYHDQLSLNEEVTVSSLVSQYKVGAQVINLGKSIIQIPTRLQITPQIIQWGREATIDLPANNKFILGEKIHITNQSKKIFIKDARAKIVPTKNTETIKYDNKKNSITNVDTNNSGIYQFKSSSKDLNFKLLDLKNKNNLFPKLSKHFTEGLYRALSTKPPIYRMNLLKEFKIASFAIHKESLYLSLKNKNIESKFVILKVDNFRSHNNKKIKVNLWKEIEPPINYNIQISNIAFINGSLLIIAESESSEQELSIYALQLNLSNDKITLVNSWVNQSLQELIYNSETDNIEIVLSTNDGRRTNETINIH